MSNIYESLAKVEKEKFKSSKLAEQSSLGEHIKKKETKIKVLKPVSIGIFSLLLIILIGVNILSYNQQKLSTLAINKALLKSQEIENSMDQNSQQVSKLLNNLSELENNVENLKKGLDKVGSSIDISNLTLVKVDSRISNLEKDNANRNIAINDIKESDNQLLKKYSELRVKLEKFKYLILKSEEVTTEPIIVTADLESN